MFSTSVVIANSLIYETHLCFNSLSLCFKLIDRIFRVLLHSERGEIGQGHRC